MHLQIELSTYETVVHYADKYVRDDVHTNTVEDYFAIFKRGVYGTFYHVSEAHLPRYLAEFDFRNYSGPGHRLIAAGYAAMTSWMAWRADFPASLAVAMTAAAAA